MEKFNVIKSVAIPLDRANIDTDQIIPKQFLRSIRRTGFGQFLFDEWRYLDPGDLDSDCAARPKNPDFVLNDSRYQHAQILLTQENFGCGSSREHAVWALMEYGFRVVIAPSFGDIFASNAVKNGLLPVSLDKGAITALFAKTADATPVLTVDLSAQQVSDGDGGEWRFTIDAEIKKRLLAGLDDIAVTLQHADAITAYENRRRQQEPWLFTDKRL